MQEEDMRKLRLTCHPAVFDSFFKYLEYVIRHLSTSMFTDSQFRNEAVEIMMRGFLPRCLPTC